MSQEAPPWKFAAGDPAPNTNSLFAPDDGNFVNGGADVGLVSTPSGAANANLAVSIFDGEIQFGQSTADGSLQFATALLADGTYGVTATTTDSSGSDSSASAAVNVAATITVADGGTR